MINTGNKRHPYIYVMDHHLSAVCVCLSVCLLPHNLGECFVSLLFEHIAGKNVSPSDKKKFVAIFKKFLSCREIVSVKPYRSVAILKFLHFC